MRASSGTLSYICPWLKLFSHDLRRRINMFPVNSHSRPSWSLRFLNSELGTAARQLILQHSKKTAADANNPRWRRLVATTCQFEKSASSSAEHYRLCTPQSPQDMSEMKMRDM